MKKVTLPRGNCVICGLPITADTDSREHVITNAIGGRLKTNGFICQDCNSTKGHSWDTALARQLNGLCLYFGIARERGESPTQQIETTTGERFELQHGGGLMPHKPTIKEIQREGGRLELQITAQTMEEARKILKRKKRKYPGLDIEQALRTATNGLSAPTGVLKLSSEVGGVESDRSIVKTTAAFAHCVGLEVDGLNTALEYLRNSDAEAPFGYYYEVDLVIGRPAGVPIHCVAVSGIPEHRLLLGYVEFFGVHRAVVCLSDRYSGEAIHRAYAIDPTTGKTFDVQVRLPFSMTDLRQIYAYEKIPPGAMERAFTEVLIPARKRQYDNETHRQISDAVNYAWKNCGAKAGDIMTEELAGKMVALIAERMQPFLLHRIRQRRGREDAANSALTGR